jgi:hypothetical protein
LILVAFSEVGEHGDNALEDEMRRLSEWPVIGVVLVCITWVLLCVFVPLLWMSIQMRSHMVRLERTGGVEGMAVQVDGVIVLLPPLVFCVAWLLSRRRARRRVAHPEG